MQAARDYRLPALAATGNKWLMLALVGFAGLGAGYIFDKQHFFLSYLVGYMFWLNVALGMLGLLMIQHLSGGAWGVVSRRIFEAGARTIPAMAIFFIPVVLGMHNLYEWTHADVVAKDPILQHKAPYLNESAWLIRAVIYFVIWSLMAFLLASWSSGQDRDAANVGNTKRMRMLSGPGLIVFSLTVTFMSVDWFMSLEPHWFSTMYPVLFVVAQGLAALCVTILVLSVLSNREPMANVIQPAHLHDLGKLTMAFVMLWAYVNFSQYLIMWAGNLAEEVPWYLRRTRGGWVGLAGFLILFHFALPFLLLLSRSLKRNPRTLAMVAAGLLAMRVVDIFWFLRPAVAAHGHLEEGHAGLAAALKTVWIDAAALAAIGGIWLFLFFRQLAARPLLPANDPNFEEALHHHGGH